MAAGGNVFPVLEGLAWAARLCDALGEIFCLTFVRGVDAAESLRRMGAYPETLGRLRPAEMWQRQESFDAGYPRMAGAVELGGWAVVLEPYGFAGAGSLLAAVSRGTEAVSVLRHDYASPHVGYAVDGTTVTEFQPGLTGHVWGADPGRLDEHLHPVGLADPADTDPADSADTDSADSAEDVEDSGFVVDAVPRALVLAARVTGVMPAIEALTGPMLSAQIEPWFTTAEPDSGVLAADRWSPNRDRAALLAAVAAASPAVKRAVAVAEIRRIAGLLGVADAPGLTDTLAEAEAEAGRAGRVLPDSPLGRQVRDWLRQSATASWSLNGPDRHRMTDAERTHANLLGWLAQALRGALHPDPDIAVRAALYPLATGPAPFTDPTVQTATISRLHS